MTLKKQKGGKQMRLNKKILSLVLAGAMVVSLAPSNVGVVSKMAAASGKMSAKSYDYDPAYQTQETLKDESGEKIGTLTYTNKAYFNSIISRYNNMTLESEDGNSIYTDTILFFDFDYNATTGTTSSAIGSEDSSSLDIEDMYKKKAAAELKKAGADEKDVDYSDKLNKQVSADWKADVKVGKKIYAKLLYYYYDKDDKKQSGEVKLAFTLSDSYKKSEDYKQYAIYKYETDDDNSYVVTNDNYLYSGLTTVDNAYSIGSCTYQWYKADASGEYTKINNQTSSSVYLKNSNVIDPQSKTDDKLKCIATVKYDAIEIQSIEYDYTVYKVSSDSLYTTDDNSSWAYAKKDGKAVLNSGYEAINGATAKYTWQKYDEKEKTYKTIDGQSGKTLTIDKCTDADYVSYRAKIQISVGECLYTSFEKTIQLVENPPYSVNNKTGYGKNAEKDDADGKYYSQYSLSNNVVPGDTDNMTVDVKADTGYSLTYTWYEYKDGKWNEITDAKTNVYSKKFETADFDSTTSKQYKCKVTASNGTLTYDKSCFIFFENRDPEMYENYSNVKYGSTSRSNAKDNALKTAIGSSATLSGPKVSVNSQYQLNYQWQKFTKIDKDEYNKNHLIKVDENTWETNTDYGYTSVYDEDKDEDVYTYYKWTDIKDATADTYTIASVTDTAEKSDFGEYRLKYNAYKAGTTDLTNAKSVASGEFYVDLEQFNGFTAALPKNTEDNYTLEVGGTIDLGVTASIANTEANNQKYDIAYQWQKYDSKTKAYIDIKDATTADYKKENITADDFGKYKCVITVIDKTTKAVISDVKPAEFEFNIKQAVKAENDTLTLKSESSYVVNHKNVGDNVTLSVAAETADAAKYPLTYKWEKIEKDSYSDSYGKYVDVMGADGKAVSTADYALNIADENAFTTYRCTVSNGAHSQKVTFNVLKNDNFYAYAAATKSDNKTFIKKAGESVKMQVVNGSDDAAATFSYKWYACSSNHRSYKNEDDDDWYTIGDGYVQKRLANTTSVYEISSLTDADFDVNYYYCEVKNELTKETKTVTFYVKKYDTTDITFTDLDGAYDSSGTSCIDVELGSSKEFGAVVKNPESKNFIYKWSFEKLHKDDTKYEYDYERALDCTTEKLTLSNITEDNLGRYTLRIYEGSAADDDTPVITHYFEVSKKDAAAKKFTLSAVGNGQTGYYRSVGGNVTFATELSTESTDTVTYQWYQGGYYDDDDDTYNKGDAILGETGSSLNLTNLRKSDFGKYTCVAKAGKLIDFITFSVSEADAITVDWNNDEFDIYGGGASYNKTVKAKIGDSTNLTAVVTSATGDAISYQWYEENLEDTHYNFYAKDNVEKGAYKIMQGQTTDTLALNQMTKDAFKRYKLEITNGGYTVNVYFTLVRTDLPKVSVKADKTSLEKGETAVLTAKVTNLGDKTATYQWYKNGKKIDGATAATYTTEALFSDLNELKDDEKSVTYKCEVSTDIDKVSDEISINFAGWGTISQTKDFVMKGDTVDIGIKMKEAGDWKYTWYKKDAVSDEYVKVPEATSATISAIATSDDSKKLDNNRYKVVAEKGSDETYVSYYAYADVDVFNISDMTTLPSGKVAAYNKDADEETNYNQYFGYGIDGASKLRMTFSKDSNLYDSNAALYVFELDTQKIHRFDGYDLAGRTYVFDSGKCVFELTSAGSDKYTSGTDGFTVEKAINPDIDYSTLSVSKKSVKLNAGKSATITYRALDNFGDTTKVTAKTSNKKVATVSVAAGKVTIKAAGKAKGAATAKITLKNGTKKATIKVTINNPVKKVKAAKKKATVKKKKTVKLTFKVTSYNKAKKTSDKITYKTSKKKVAKITKKKVSSKKIIVSVKGLKKGTSKITVTIGKKKAVVTVKVK